MKKLTVVLSFLLIGLCFQTINAQDRKAKDRAAFISNTKLLERIPLNENAGAARNWNFKYVADTDEVSVVLCSDSMKLIPEKKNKFKGELLMQFTFGMAVFKLENPAQKDDEKAATLAGMESVLRTYEAMVKENEKAKSVQMDELLAKSKNGELKTLIDGLNCDKKK